MKEVEKEVLAASRLSLTRYVIFILFKTAMGRRGWTKKTIQRSQSLDSSNPSYFFYMMELSHKIPKEERVFQRLIGNNNHCMLHSSTKRSYLGPIVT
jgi:hypothetical protein